MVTYECGCTADGDLVSPKCPMHGMPEKRKLSHREEASKIANQITDPVMRRFAKEFINEESR